MAMASHSGSALATLPTSLVIRPRSDWFSISPMNPVRLACRK